MKSIDQLLTTAQVAKHRGVSREAVRLAVKTGALHPTRRTHPMLFHPRDVDEWTPYVAIMRRAAKARQEASKDE
jgi:hypothetical protein